MTNLLIASGATLIGFFVGLVLTALLKKAGNSKDDQRWDITLKHQEIVEKRLSRYAEHAERSANAIETIAQYLIKSKPVQHVMTELDIDHLVSSCPGDVGLVDWVHYCMQQRIDVLQTNFKQSLKTVRKHAFIAGVVKGNPSIEGRSTVDEAAEKYAMQMEQGDAHATMET